MIEEKANTVSRSQPCTDGESAARPEAGGSAAGLDLDALERLALGVTHLNPWNSGDKADSAFVVACKPETILRLIASNRAMAKELSEASNELHCCDDVVLGQGLAAGIADLSEQRGAQRARAEAAEASERPRSPHSGGRMEPYLKRSRLIALRREVRALAAEIEAEKQASARARTKSLAPHQQRVLEVLAEDYAEHEWVAHPFSSLTHLTGLSRDQVRRACRGLRALGLVKLEIGLWTDDGEMAGAGYRVTADGMAWLRPPLPPESGADDGGATSATPGDSGTNSSSLTTEC